MKGFVWLWAQRHSGSGGVLNQCWPMRLTLWRRSGMPRGYLFTITHLLGLPYLPLWHQFKYAFDYTSPLSSPPTFSFYSALFFRHFITQTIWAFRQRQFCASSHFIIMSLHNATWCLSFNFFLSILTISSIVNWGQVSCLSSYSLHPFNWTGNNWKEEGASAWRNRC